MAKERIHKARFAELVSSGVEGFGDAIGVEGENIAGCELTFADFALPLPENAKNGAGSIEAYHGAIDAQDQRGQVAAVGIAQQPRSVIVFAEE